MRNRVESRRVGPGDDGVGPELVRRCRRGDRAALEELVLLTTGRAYRLALRIVGDRHEAEDVVQDAYLRIFRALPGFREEARFETWMHRIVVNAALNRLRSLGRFGEVVEEGAVDLPASDRPADRVADRDALERALALLPPGQRMAVVLKEVADLSCREIAEELGIEEGAVKVRLHRARRHLRALLEEADGDEG